MIQIPIPVLVTVDDVGWWSGRDRSALNQPFRTGMPRPHVPEDYEALVSLGRALDMRIPAGFVLCEWDRTGLLRSLPSSTWMGEQWRGFPWNRAETEKAVQIIQGGKPFLEIALHGVGHEFWINGQMDRSEFHNASGKMRHPDEVEKHLDFFFRLLDQIGLDSGVRMFIPPALHHSFGDGQFQRIAAPYGIQYVTLVFARAKWQARPQFPGAAWENRVVLLERGESPVSWNRASPRPEFDFDHPILPLHWANLLDENPAKNIEVVHAWAEFIRGRAREEGRVLARDIAGCLTQYLNATQSSIRQEGRDFIIHMDWIRRVPEKVLGDKLFFRVKNPESASLKIFGAEKKQASCPDENRFLKLGLPKSGKVVIRFGKKD